MLVSNSSGEIIETTINNQTIYFFVNNPEDWIQREHLKGDFYETADLKLISKWVNRDTRYLDIGTNVGNHVLYLHKFKGIKNSVVIEPNPLSIRMLEINFRLNNIYPDVDTSLLGIGLSNTEGAAYLKAQKNNLGGTRCVVNEDGAIKISTGDRLLQDRMFDFVKIDIEGMEIECLEGMQNIIRRCRPTMYIEVDNENLERYQRWCEQHQYMNLKRIKHYKQNQNFLAVAKENNVN